MAIAAKRPPQGGLNESSGNIIGFVVSAAGLVALLTYVYTTHKDFDWGRGFNAFAIYVALGIAVVFAIRELKGRATDPRLWSLSIGYGVAVAMLTTLWVAGTPITSFIWGLVFAVFAAFATVLAVSTRDSALPWQTWAVTAAASMAAAAAVTLTIPAFLNFHTQWIYVVAIFVATSITVLLLFLNERVFVKRKAILQALLDQFAKAKPSVSQFDYPALNLAALRYGGSLHDGRRNEPREIEAAAEPRTSRWPLFFSAIAYLVFCALGYLLLLAPLCKVFGLNQECRPAWIDLALFWSQTRPSGDTPDLIPIVAIAGAAFLGAHIFTLRFLFKAALNSELNQFKWIRGALHVLTGVVVAVVFYRVFSGTDLIKKIFDDDKNAAALWLGLAFFAGWMPDLALTGMFRRLKITGLKFTDEDIYKSVSAVPVEVLDGVDYDIRYRLDENNIVDVQNLATYNPIALYVETPYSLAEIFDWVQQAQLCTQVGSKAYVELKSLGIRTIGQLETQVAAGSAAYVSMIGRALYAGVPADKLRPISKPVKAPKAKKKKDGDAGADPQPPAPDIDAQCVKKAVATMCADPYIRGLKRLWDYVNAGALKRAS